MKFERKMKVLVLTTLLNFLPTSTYSNILIKHLNFFLNFINTRWVCFRKQIVFLQAVQTLQKLCIEI